MKLVQLSFVFDDVMTLPSKRVRRVGESNLKIKTALLSEFPNDFGVYVCTPDEVLEWVSKKNSVKINLLSLENGEWLYSYDINVGTLHMSSPLSLSHYGFDDRVSALKQAQSFLRSQETYFNNWGLNNKYLKSFCQFVDGLTCL